MQDKKYRDSFGISQSMIKDFRFKSPKKWHSIHVQKMEDLDKSDESFTFGSLVDTLMFTPEILNERFYIGDLKLPSKAVAWIIEEVFADIQKKNREIAEQNLGPVPELVETVPFNLESVPEIVLSMARQYPASEDQRGWNNDWKEQTIINSLIKKGDEYFNSLVEADGRKVISQKMNFEAIEIKKILLADPDVRQYFVEEEGVELNFQMEVFVNYLAKTGKEIPLKGAFDILRIDHNLKTIQLIDFKTSYSAFDFISSIKKYGYALQLSYYDFLLRLWLDQECEGALCDYTILNPINIVIDNYDKIPYIYEYSWSDLEMEKMGNESFLNDLFHTSSHNAKIKKGWLEILETIAWHYHNDYWQKTKELYENGKIKVNLLNT